MKIKQNKMLSILTGLSMASAPVFAAQAVLEETFVTAQKREQTLQEVPISVNVLSESELKLAQVLDGRSLVQLTPSMTFTEGYSSIATTYNIRGVGSYVFEGGIQPAVSMVVDGTPLARPGEFVADLADIERIEVLNGPQGTLFGRNSTGGAINIVRKRPTEEFEGYVEVGYSQGKQDDNGSLVRFGVSGPLADGVKGRLGGFYREEDGYIENLFPGVSDSGGVENWGLLGKLEFDLSDSVNLLLTGEYREADENMGASLVTEPLQPVQFPQFPDITQQHIDILDGGSGSFTINQDDEFKTMVEAWAMTAELQWDINDELSLVSISSYHDVESNSQPDVDATPASPDNPLNWTFVSIPETAQGVGEIPRRVVGWDYFSQELRLNYSNDKVDLVGGVFYQTYDESLANQVPLLIRADVIGMGFLVGPLLDPDYPYFFNDAAIRTANSLDTYAAFADLTYHVSDTFEVFAGYRLTYEEVDFSYDRESWFIPVISGVTYDHATSSPLVPGVCTGEQATSTCDPTAPTTKFSGGADETNWSGRVGASWDISDTTTAYVSASRGFIGPAVDLSRATAGNPEDPGAALLDPTTAINYEIGLKATLWDDRLEINGAVFQLEVEDLQSSALIPGTVSTRTQNAGDIETLGLELSFVAAATNNLTLSGGLSFLDSEFQNLNQPCYPGQSEVQGCIGGVQSVDGKDALNTPELKYNLAANLNMPFESMPFDGYGRLGYVWQDDVGFTLDHDPMTVQDSYGLLDLTLGIAARDGRYNVSLWGKNLTDEQFCENKQASRVIARVFCYSSRSNERTIGIKATFNF